MTLREYNIYHRPVMLNECLEYLDIKPDGTYIDCTTGGGGHSNAILDKLGKGGILLCIDKDADALQEAGTRFSGYTGEGKYILAKGDFSDLDRIIREHGIEQADGIIADFGVSSFQLDENKRGFGYMREGPLDMRMDTRSDLTAQTVVNTYSQEELERVIREYGEERYASSIARTICREREEKPFKTTTELAEAIASAMPAKARREKQHPAKRTFQGIRIEVNGELDAIQKLMEVFPDALKPGGRFAAISFHSLEDRIVKEAFRRYEYPCTCPKDFPVCVCGKKPLGKALTKKPVIASDEETEFNPRARSAKLRVFEKAYKSRKEGEDE